MITFHALRYVEGTPILKRNHAATLGRFESFDSAETARPARFNGHLLEVVERTVPAPKVVLS